MQKNLSKALLSGLALVFGVQAAGCANVHHDSYFHDVRLSTATVNRDTFTSLADFDAKLKTLTLGMKEDDVYKTLGILPERFSMLPPEKISEVLFGGQVSKPQTKEDHEYIKDLIRRAKVARINFKEVHSSGALRGFLGTESEDSGFDMQLTLSFEDGLLANGRASGTPHVNTVNRTYFWETAGTLFKGVAFGGAAVGGAAILKK